MQDLFDFQTTVKDNITYYIIPKGKLLYHGSDTIDSHEDLNNNKHTFFALTNEYASKYSKEKGNVFEFKTIKDIYLVAMDKDNVKLFNDAPENIKKIMDNNYGFHNGHIRKSIGEQDRKLSKYLCENKFNGYAANNMKGKSFTDDLDAELVICNKDNLKYEKLIKNKTIPNPPKIERKKRKGPELFYDDDKSPKKGPGLFYDYEDDDKSSRKGPGLFDDDKSPRKGPGLFDDDDDDDMNVFRTPIKGGKEKQNISSVYKRMKRPVRAEDGTYTIKGKKYKELFGSREQVYNGTAYKTKAGLTNDDILMNKRGRIVSSKKYKSAKKEMRLEKHGYSAKKGKFGYVKVNKTRKQKKD